MELMRRKRVDSASYPNMMRAAEKAQFSVPFADDAQINSALSLKTLIFTTCFFYEDNGELNCAFSATAQS
jgi:hypothetical protein